MSEFPDWMLPHRAAFDNFLAAHARIRASVMHDQNVGALENDAEGINAQK